MRQAVWTANVTSQLQVIVMHHNQQEMGQREVGITCSCAASLASMLVMASMWAASLNLSVSSSLVSLSLILCISCTCIHHDWKRMTRVHVAVSVIGSASAQQKPGDRLCLKWAFRTDFVLG